MPPTAFHEDGDGFHERHKSEERKAHPSHPARTPRPKLTHQLPSSTHNPKLGADVIPQVPNDPTSYALWPLRKGKTENVRSETLLRPVVKSKHL